MNEFSHNYRIASAETSDMQFVTTSLRSQMHFLHPNTFKKNCPKGTERVNRLFYGINYFFIPLLLVKLAYCLLTTVAVSVELEEWRVKLQNLRLALYS